MRKMNRLKSLIKRNHMSQQDFADWFCVQRFTAWQILNEKRPLKADEIVKICTRFDVSADWLLGLSDSEKSYETEWIPVTERLPEYCKEVLTCSDGGFIEIQSLENFCDDGYWENQKGDWTDLDEVIAWMPLPQPYEAESEGKE